MARWHRHLRRAGLLIGALAAALAVVGVGLNLWVRLKAAGDIHESIEAVPTLPVAIVPEASVYADGRPSDALADRLEAALALHRSGKVDRILVSGLRESPAYDEVTAMARWLRDRGVQADEVLEDAEGYRTLDTMERAARVFGVDEAVICTQRLHLPRAIYLAKHAGIAGVGLVADRQRYRGVVYDWAREFLARIRAVLDVVVLNTGAASLEPPGEGRSP